MQKKSEIMMGTEELKKKIAELKKEKNAVILGHYYQRKEVQEVSDYIGDSLELSRRAQECKSDIIVFCGVHFMAETAKILNPQRKVLLPDMNASCSLAESCKADDLKKMKEKYPDHYVISYINCSAEIKALSDLICTSGNAEKLIGGMPKDKKIIFAPDKNLGGYINSITGRNMLLWDGVCMVHDAMQAEMVMKLKAEYKDAPIIAHPECNSALLAIADFVGSTKAMLNYIGKSGANRFIVATESGILHEMKKNNPGKEFIAVNIAENKECGCTDCSYMKLNTLEKVYDCLLYESPEIIMEKELMEAARKPIIRMLDMSKELGII